MPIKHLKTETNEINTSLPSGSTTSQVTSGLNEDIDMDQPVLQPSLSRVMSLNEPEANLYKVTPSNSNKYMMPTEADLFSSKIL